MRYLKQVLLLPQLDRVLIEFLGSKQPVSQEATS